MFMKPFKLEEIEIDDPQKPFEKCKLDREGFAIRLTNLISYIEQPYVININSEYGTGKTTFVRMWQKLLEKESYGYKTIMFNAWETDFTESPFAAFLGEIQQFIDEEKQRGKVDFEGSIEKVKQSVKELASTGVIKALSSATSGVLSENQIRQILQIISDNSSELEKKINAATGGELDKYLAQKEAIKTFKDALGEFVDQVYGEDSNKPLIFIIDELDRCRPDYALALLETIKHLFSIKRIVFVLVSERNQLNEFVKVKYGRENDTDGYLRKYIDIDFRLPYPDREKFIKYVFDQWNIFEDLPSEKAILFPYHNVIEKKDSFLNAIKLFSDAFELTLWQIERLVKSMSLGVASSNTDVVHLDLLLFFAVLKNIDNQTYLRLLEGEIELKKVVEQHSNFFDFLRFNMNERKYAVFCFKLYLYEVTHRKKLHEVVESTNNEDLPSDISVFLREIFKVDIDIFKSFLSPKPDYFDKSFLNGPPRQMIVSALELMHLDDHT